VRDGGGRCAIDLNQHEARRIVGLLSDIKAGNASFTNTGPCVRQRGGFETLNVFGLGVNVNVDDEHGGWIYRKVGVVAPRLPI
jgi:hypothetical protein